MDISKRASQISPSPTFAVDARAKQMKKKGHNVIGFGAGEPDFDTPEYIKKAASEAIEQGFTKYTPVAGTVELRRAIIDYLHSDIGLSYDEDQVIVSNGGKQCLFNALYCLINPGDKVLIPSPYWVSYPEMVKLCGGIPVFVDTSKNDGFELKADDLRPHIDERTKVLIINSPSNPTGSVYSKEDLLEISYLATDNNMTIISDEIYEKLIYDDEKHFSIALASKDSYDSTVIINGMSKAFAMTGWRMGYAAGPKSVIKAMTSLQSHTTSNANSIAQKASLGALVNGDRNKIIESMALEFKGRRDYMVSTINSINLLSCPMPKGAFYVMLNISKTFGKRYDDVLIDDSTSFAESLLNKMKVAVVPGIAFGNENFVRLSYATSIKNIKEGLGRIREFVENLK